MSDLSCRALPVIVAISSGAWGCGSTTALEEVAEQRAALVPAGYYDTVDAASGSTLRDTLHAVIDDHQRYPYTSSATDTWNVLEAAQEDPASSARILDLYRNASYPKYGAGNTDYNREHVWPSSYGFPSDSSQNYPYSDCHQLFLSDDSYNSSRSNKLYRYCDAACTEKPTLANDGLGGGTGIYSGNSNWTSGSLTSGTWETWIGRRGDVARAIFYLDVRYEGGTHGVTGVSEPSLIVTDNEAQIASSNTGSNESVAYMGLKSVLLEWHAQDPPDDFERKRNDVVHSYQGNRNPFVDHPEWIDCLYSGVCGGGGCTSSAQCDDGLFCDGAESCVSGACVAGTAPCAGQTCDEGADVCVPQGCNGDGICDAGEDCSDCPSDCASGGAQCGNGACEAGNGEDCVSCPADCNGLQAGKTSRRFCCGDGGGQFPVSCGDARCTSSGWQCTSASAEPYCCGNGVVEGPESNGGCDGNP